MKTFTEKLEALRVLFEAERRAELINGGMPAHMLDDGHYYRARIVTGKWYAKLDFGTSGVYMIVNDTGEIFGIKAYGVIHRGHKFGTLDTINDWCWGGYRAFKRPINNEADEVSTEELQAAGAVYDKLASGTFYPVGTRFIDGTVQS